MSELIMKDMPERIVPQQEEIVERLQRSMLAMPPDVNPEDLKTFSQALAVQIDKLVTLRSARW